MDYFLGALKKYADFSGRARRKEYWMYMLFYFIAAIIVAFFDIVLGISFLSIILGLALLIPTISITTRRLHDTDRTGWWQLVFLVPIVGFIVMLVFMCMDSHPDNEYGPNPKGLQADLQP